MQQTTAFDPAFQLAAVQVQLGRVYDNAGQTEQAIPILHEAAAVWERLVRQQVKLSESTPLANLLSNQTPKARQQRATCAVHLENLAATLGDLAHALMNAGRPDEALHTSEQSFAMERALGYDSNAVYSLVRTAQILMAQGHYQEADTCYDQTLAAARQLGTRNLEGTILQHQGSLAEDRQQYDRAVHLYQQAMQHFQDTHDEGAIMRTCNLLGNVEGQAGRLHEARAWYERCREIAQRRRDMMMLSMTVQNLGIVCQEEGEAALQHGGETTARQRFVDAERFLQESLQIAMEQRDKPGEAASRGQLSRGYLLLDDLAQAAVQAQHAQEISESLDLLRELPFIYDTLTQIARV